MSEGDKYNVTVTDPESLDKLFEVVSGTKPQLHSPVKKLGLPSTMFIEPSVSGTGLHARTHSLPPNIGAQARELPLPYGWEAAFTKDGHTYYIDHNRKTTQWEHPLRVGSASRFPGHPLQNHQHASITPALPYNAPHHISHQLHQAQTPTHALSGGHSAGWDQMGTSTPPGELAQQHYSPHQHRPSLGGGQPGPHQYSSSHSGSIGSPGAPGSMVGGQAGAGYLHQRQQSMPHILSSPSHPQAHWEQIRRNERGKLLGDPYLTAEHIRQSSQDSGVVANLSSYGHDYAMADEMDSPVGAGGGGHGASFGQQSQLPPRRNMEIIDHLPGANVDTGMTGMETDNLQPSIDPSMMVGDLENYSQWV